MWLSPPSCCEKRLKWGKKAHLVAKIPPKRGIWGDFDVQKGCDEAIIGRETRGLERGEKRANTEGAGEWEAEGSVEKEGSEGGVLARRILQRWGKEGEAAGRRWGGGEQINQ